MAAGVLRKACFATAAGRVARTRIWMTGVNDKIWFRRGGLFAKYVVSLVGLVVFVLAVNGALEIWISYRETKATLTNAMSEKAEASAPRIEQSMTDLERQISRVTRASLDTVEKRKADYALLMNQLPAVSQIFQLDGAGREQLRVTRSRVSIGSAEDFSRDPVFTQMPTEIERTCCISSVMTVSPFGNTSRRILRGPSVMSFAKSSRATQEGAGKQACIYCTHTDRCARGDKVFRFK